MRKLALVDEEPRPQLFSVRVDRDRVSIRHDFVCENCGYGIHVANLTPLPSCPMCQRSTWRSLTGR
jgi:rubrerythrin